MRAFLIDDEKMYYKLLKPALNKAGHELGYAQSGEEGLKNIAEFDPDVIVLDLKLSDTTGFAILERLQGDVHFRHVPVIFVTSSDELESKLKAFSLGAEDYVTKPFKPEELVARIEILARRREYLKAAETVASNVGIDTSTIVTVHSLRGGVGCTSVAINLAFAYNSIWNRPTIILDAILTSGQVAMFMNSSPRSTWKDIAERTTEELDIDLIKRLINQHKSGVRYVASPKLPIPFENFIDTFSTVIDEYKKEHDFIVIDTPHDFSDIAIKTLDVADHILFLITPEMGSLRAAICALQTYDSLGYTADKVQVVLNHVCQAPSLKTPQIEKAIGHKIDLELPYSNEVNQAINLGEPFQASNSNLQITQQLEDCAYNLSRDTLKNLPPAQRTPAWTRVNRRLKSRK